MGRFQKVFALVLILFYPHAHALTVMDIQGVMLQRISSFINWPELPDQTMTVCIVGDNSFVTHLQQLYRKKKLHGLPIEVKSVDEASTISTLTSCQVIFFANEKSRLFTKNIEETKSEGLLIVSGNEQDIYNGATVTLFPDKNKFKIVINKTSLQSQKLKADYRLMKLAEVVEIPVKNHETE